MQFKKTVLILLVFLSGICNFVHAADTWVPSITVSNCGIDLRNSPTSPQPNYSYVWINDPAGTTYRYFFDKNNDTQMKQAQAILSVAMAAKTTGTTIGLLHNSGYISQIQMN